MSPEARMSQGFESVYLLHGGTGVIEECYCTTLEERRKKRRTLELELTYVLHRGEPYLKCMQPSLWRKIMIVSILWSHWSIVPTGHERG